MNDAIIIGAGPAGCTAALWLKQLGFNPVVIDRQTTCGGLQLSNPYSNSWITTSPNTTGAEVAEAIHASMIEHNIRMHLGVSALNAKLERSIVSVRLSDGRLVSGKFLILAGGVTPKTGGYASRIGMLIGPGPTLAKTKFVGEKVAILGGGDSAMETYTMVKKWGAAEVRIFARSIKARSEMVASVSPDDVVLGDCKVDADSNLVNGERFGQILVLYGYEASAASLLGLELAMKPDGFVMTDEDCMTSKDGVYAIGELARRGHPCCLTSMADGVTVAKAIQRKIESTAITRFAGMTKRALGLGAAILK